GKLVPAQRSLSLGGLPIGLAHRMALRRPVARGQIVTWEDVAIDQQDSAVAFRREMEQVFQALN
ncbi:MAG: flagellar biosynthesis protein FlgA, partial [bacterium]